MAVPGPLNPPISMRGRVYPGRVPDCIWPDLMYTHPNFTQPNASRTFVSQHALDYISAACGTNYRLDGVILNILDPYRFKQARNGRSYSHPDYYGFVYQKHWNRLVGAAVALTSRWNAISPTGQETPLASSALRNANPDLDVLQLQEKWFLAKEKYLTLCVEILHAALAYNVGFAEMTDIIKDNLTWCRLSIWSLHVRRGLWETQRQRGQFVRCPKPSTFAAVAMIAQYHIMSGDFHCEDLKLRRLDPLGKHMKSASRWFYLNRVDRREALGDTYVIDGEDKLSHHYPWSASLHGLQLLRRGPPNDTALMLTHPSNTLPSTDVFETDYERGHFFYYPVHDSTFHDPTVQHFTIKLKLLCEHVRFNYVKINSGLTYHLAENLEYKLPVDRSLGGIHAVLEPLLMRGAYNTMKRMFRAGDMDAWYTFAKAWDPIFYGEIDFGHTKLPSTTPQPQMTPVEHLVDDLALGRNIDYSHVV